MKELKCKNCGATLTYKKGLYVCSYCGSIYQDESYNPSEFMIIERQSANCITLEAKAFVQMDSYKYWPKEAISEHIVNDLATSLADTIKEYLLVDKNMDLQNCAEIYRGRIRIIPPNFKYYY